MHAEQPATPANPPAMTKPKLRWFHLTPGRLLVLLLAVEAVLLLSERFRWFPFNEHKGWMVLIAVAAIGVFLLLMLLWFVFALLFRRRFQFSIRSLLFLMVAVAVPSSWLAVEMKWAREQKETVDSLRKLGGRVEVNYDYQYNSIGSFIQGATSSDPMWLRKLLGDDFFRQLQTVNLVHTTITDMGLENLKGLEQLHGLSLLGSKITGFGLEHLRRLKQLQGLSLAETQITDDGFVHLEGLKQLQTLSLAATQITNVGVEHLEGLEQLQYLNLRRTQVTDAGLKHFEVLKQLIILDLRETRVTDAGIAELQKALPNCHIVHGTWQAPLTLPPRVQH